MEQSAVSVRGTTRKRALAAAAVVSAGAFVATAQLSGSGRVSAASTPPQQPATTLECPPGDLVFTMTGVRSAGGSGASTPESAVAREIGPIYRNLPKEAFRRGRANTAAVELAHEPQGRRLADVVVTRKGRGWAVESFAACNSLLRKGRP